MSTLEVETTIAVYFCFYSGAFILFDHFRIVANQELAAAYRRVIIQLLPLASGVVSDKVRKKQKGAYMVKKTLTFLVAMVLLCSLSACAGEAELPVVSPTISTQDRKQPPMEPVDYTVFCSNYSDTETVEGPCYTVSILSVDNTTKAIEISISYVGVYSSPVYMTEPIHASIASNHTVQFEWTDSWMNQGVGTLVLNPGDPSAVQLMMTVTEEAEVNRATLSTGGQYRTFTRR